MPASHAWLSTRLQWGMALAIALAPASTPAQESQSAQRVLIATEQSAFKDAVVAEVAQALRQDGHSVTIIGLDKLGAEPTADYQAIIVINTCRAWRPSREVRDFLRRVSEQDRKRLLVLTTANSGECDVKVNGVDAISSASKRAYAPAMSQRIIDKVRARLAGP
jgi:sulfite reductase alpha subunit-like flavoprotein